METRRTNGYKTLGFFQKVKLADSTKNKIARPWKMDSLRKKQNQAIWQMKIAKNLTDRKASLGKVTIEKADRKAESLRSCKGF